MQKGSFSRFNQRLLALFQLFQSGKAQISSHTARELVHIDPLRYDKGSVIAGDVFGRGDFDPVIRHNVFETKFD